MTTRVTILVNFFGLFLILFGMIESGLSATLDENTGKNKGDLGDINEPGSSPPKWDAVNTDSNSNNKNKGDLGVIDPRGTVRWNILADGRIARGIPTTIGVNDWPIEHAKEKTHSDVYEPKPIVLELDD